MPQKIFPDSAAGKMSGSLMLPRFWWGWSTYSGLIGWLRLGTPKFRAGTAGPLAVLREPLLAHIGLKSSFCFHKSHWCLDLNVLEGIRRTLVSKCFLLFCHDVCLQKLSQFSCAVEIVCSYPAVHNCSNCDMEQYFNMIKSRQSLTVLMHFELNGTAHVVRIKCL